jgi:hypothetical protein
VRIGWVADGEHSFKPRKSSGRDWGQNMDAAELALAFIMHTAEFVGDEPVMRLDAVRALISASPSGHRAGHCPYSRGMESCR